MKSSLIVTCLCLALAASPATLRAAGSYSESLTAADTALAAQNFGDALKEVEAALAQASNQGEKALALAKKGYVLAYGRQDYAGARAAADEALQTEGLAAVAKVTALQVVAQCQMKTDKDFAGALENLKSAMALEGVDWAKPALGLAQGDCHRELGQLDEALAAYRSVLEMPTAGSELKAGAHLCTGFVHQYARKDVAQARESYTRAVELRPSLKAEVDGHLARLPKP